MGGVGLDAAVHEVLAPGVVEGLHAGRIAGEGLGRSHVLDPDAGPNAVGVAKGVQAGFPRDAGAGEHDDVFALSRDHDKSPRWRFGPCRRHTGP